MSRARYISSGIIIGCFLLALGLLGSLVQSLSANAGGNEKVLGSQAATSPEYTDATLKETAEGINQLRKDRGLPQLAQSADLDRIAQIRADDMAKHGYYAHEGKDGRFFSDHMKEQGVGYRFACENLNIYYVPNTSRYIESWMDSPDHRECMLNNTTTNYGYAITSVDSLDGLELKHHIIVAIYSN